MGNPSIFLHPTQSWTSVSVFDSRIELTIVTGFSFWLCVNLRGFAIVTGCFFWLSEKKIAVVQDNNHVAVAMLPVGVFVHHVS